MGCTSSKNKNTFYRYTYDYSTENGQKKDKYNVRYDNWTHNICGGKILYHKYPSQDNSCNPIVSQAGTYDNPTTSYYKCGGNGKYPPMSINQNKMNYPFFMNFIGSPIINYDMETFQFSNKKKKEIDVDFTPNYYYNKKIVLENIDDYNIKSILTHNCFTYFSGGVSLYSELSVNKLIKYITPYNQNYSNTYPNTANLFTTLISLNLIDKIKNNSDFKYKNNNCFYSTINEIKLNLAIKIFKNIDIFKDNLNTIILLCKNLIFNPTYILYMFYNGVDDTLIKAQYYNKTLVKLEIKVLFLFNLIFRIENEYFNENNMNTFYKFVDEYLILNINDVDDIICNLEKYMNNKINFAKKSDLTKILKSWFKYIDLINKVQYLFLISDAPKVLELEELSSNTLNKTKFLKKYFNNERMENADNLIESFPWYPNDFDISTNTNSRIVKEKKYLHGEMLKYFNFNNQTRKIINPEKIINNQNCECNNLVKNNLNADKNTIIIFSDSKYYLIPNYFSKLIKNIDNSCYYINNIFINNSLVHFTKAIDNELLYTNTYKSLFLKSNFNLLVKSKKNIYILVKVTVNNIDKKLFIITNKNKEIKLPIEKTSILNNIMIYDIFSKITYSIDLTSLL
jgi:hypothetical protein